MSSSFTYQCAIRLLLHTVLLDTINGTPACAQLLLLLAASRQHTGLPAAPPNAEERLRRVEEKRGIVQWPQDGPEVRQAGITPSLSISLWFEARVQEILKGLSENISLYGNRTVTLQSGSRSIQKGNLVLPRVPTAY